MPTRPSFDAASVASRRSACPGWQPRGLLAVALLPRWRRGVRASRPGGHGRRGVV